MYDESPTEPRPATFTPRRRTAIFGGLATALTLSTIGGLTPAVAEETPSAPASDTEAARRRWSDLLTGGAIDPSDPRVAAALRRQDEEAQEALDHFSTTAPLWPDLPFAADAANVSLTVQRIATIALAWATPGSSIHGDATIGQNLATGLQVVSDTGYFTGRTVTGNWWFWEIGVPQYLTDALVLLFDVVPATLRTTLMDAVAHFAPDPNWRGRGNSLAETGANRVDKSLRCALRGILRENPADIVLARDALSDVKSSGKNSVFTTVTKGDGFYADGSFVQHSTIAYAGTYGTVALRGIAQILALLAGSPWEVKDPQQNTIIESVEKTFAPNIFRGVMLDAVRGRAVSRQADTGAANTLAAADAALVLSAVVPEGSRAALRGRALAWIEEMPLKVEDTSGVALIARWAGAQATQVEPLREKPGHVIFAGSDRFVHRREDWGFTVSTSSKRIGRFEWGNKENAEGWYQGDGASYLLLDADRAQTDVDYWPTIDPYRLPGTTVELSERTPNFDAGTSIQSATAAWNGGTSVLDSWGTWGMDHVDHDGKLTGKLSWFSLEDAIIALGAGITSTSDAAVETTVENRALRSGTPAITVDGTRVVGSVGESSILVKPSWAHLDGVAGYVFLTPGRTRVRRLRRRGAWSDINQGSDTAGDDTVHAVNYANISLLHGKEPNGATYAYAIAPTATLQETKVLARQATNGNGPQVLANDTTIQSISANLRPGKLFLANAFGPASIEWLTTDGPASVAVAQEARSISVAVSDPSRTTDSVTITLPQLNGRGIDFSDPTVQVIDLRPVTLRIDTRARLGLTQRITLRR